MLLQDTLPQSSGNICHEMVTSTLETDQSLVDSHDVCMEGEEALPVHTSPVVIYSAFIVGLYIFAQE